MELTQEQINRILQGISIPPQPQIMVDLQMEQLQPNPDIQHIAQLISQDVGLAGTMLKIVNSPLLGLSNSITSIQQAVILLGYNAVIGLVNGISIKGELSDDEIANLNRFWDSAMDIALVCTAVSKQINFRNIDDAYSIGLFHNAGIPLMAKRFKNYFDIMAESYRTPGKRLIDIENKHFQTNHAVIGYYVARSWHLPKIVSEAIADHHNIDHILRQGNAEKTALICILKIAEHICREYKNLGDSNTNYEWETYGEEIMLYTGLSQYDIENMTSNFVDLGLIV
ncbi:HDOD domain-containing protein [Gynuella sunshinyii]|uniref:Putative signal transduction protein n=1 Tax=Gynuella sunshinyii YC6258 TaxID=1445510 RepID=A0A0C5W589_9GAMM|nr:HDOD domain-containing protein [Gynuella sunshinyii]AJQ97739.1 putative signal transduction protein [Gynuella sunshinyii YC6258]